MIELLIDNYVYVKNVEQLSKLFNHQQAICKLIKKSPKRETRLNIIKEAVGSKDKGIHTICPTRWTVRGEACAAIIDNHPYLMQLWEETLDGKIDSEMQAKIIGAQTTMETFNFLFSCSLNIRILCQIDQLSKRLKPQISLQ